MSGMAKGRHGVNVEIHLEAVIEQVWIGTWRLKSSELRDAHGGHDEASMRTHLEVWILHTSRPLMNKYGNALGCQD